MQSVPAVQCQAFSVESELTRVAVERNGESMALAVTSFMQRMTSRGMRIFLDRETQINILRR